MMLVTRLVLVITAIVLLAKGQEARTPVSTQQEVIPLSTTTDDRHSVDKDETAGDHRQGRMALHAEPPSSKVKREQALRNILAARRRQLLSPKVSDVSKNARSRTSRPSLSVSKDPVDMLEAQETRHGVYVTAPIGDQVAIVMNNDDEELVSENLAKSSTLSSLEILSKPDEQVDRGAKNSLLIRINESSEKASKNSSQPRAQKTPDTDSRRKNTVAMPESLYKHFRPVESNIPVEDMTQFLYFGQKIHPESQHNSSSGTNNSILDTTSTSASIPLSRRRYSMKRFSTTTSTAVPRLEEMINEEMNIALERSTIERNKIPKTKNVFRSPGSSAYFRKSTSKSDQTIVSNVIPNRESAARNASTESELNRSQDSSAHAQQISQVVIVSDRGSSYARSASVADNALTYRARNTTTGTTSSATFDEKIKIDRADEITDTETMDRLNLTVTSYQSTLIKAIDDSTPEASVNTESSTVHMVSTTDYELNDEKSNKITTWQFVHSNNDESTTFSATKNQNVNNESKMSTIMNKLGGTSRPVIGLKETGTALNLAHSSLRIVVTEPMRYESGARASWESAEGDGKEGQETEEEEEAKRKANRVGASTVNQEDLRKDRSRQRVGESVRSYDRQRVTGLPLNTVASGLSRISSGDASDSESTNVGLESTLVATVSGKPEQLLPATSTERYEHKQQHAYAYEITNVTRLLRNYTGAGLNVVMDRQEKEDRRKKESEDEVAEKREGEKDIKEEEEKRKTSGQKKQRKLEEEEKEGEEIGKKENEEKEGELTLMRSNDGSNAQEIRNDGGSEQQSTLPLLLLPTLQRPSNSGGVVEPAARTPGLLSAGTDVDEVTPSTTSSWSTIASTGSTPIIRSAGSSGGGSGNSGARGSRNGDSSNRGSQSAASSASSSSSSSSSSSPPLLVGERGRKGALGARQHYQQNQNRGIAAGAGRASSGLGSATAIPATSSVGTENTWPSVSTTVTSTEVSGASTVGVDDPTGTTTFNNTDRRTVVDDVTENILGTSTIRWNHTGTKKKNSPVDRADGYGNDRRYLRKSVSAVLNQRNIEEGLAKELKRRRESTLQSTEFLYYNNRRVKSSRGHNNEEYKSLSRPMDNSTAEKEVGESNNNQTIRRHEDALVDDKIADFKDEMTEEPGKVSIDPLVDVNRKITPVSLTMEETSTTVTTLAPVEYTEEMIEASDKNTNSAEAAEQGQDKIDERLNDSEQVIPGALSAVSESDGKSKLTKDETSDISFTQLPSDIVSSFKGYEESTDTPTTSAPALPVFPVTPRMLEKPDQVAKKNINQNITHISDEQSKQNDTPEASRPFGLAKDLDPSEIQKMYRAQAKTEPAVTTILPGIETDANNPMDNIPVRTSAGKDQTGTMNSSVTRKPVGGERSPEVRGRNLSDKIKDKDDVLPIMQLYNNSDIFNGTTKDLQDTVGLPGAIEVNATRQHNDDVTVNVVPEVSESSANERKEESRPQQKQLNNSDTELTGISKKNRHGVARDDTNDYTGSNRSSNANNFNNSTSTQSNRTKNRPMYYQTTPPEFVDYRTEFNGSFFEPGMISVSSRESVNISEVITKRHNGDTIATQETVAVVSYILATLIVFPIAVGVGLILRRLIIRNRKVLEESDTSSEISCRKDALNLENGDFKTSIEKAITKLPRIQHLCHEAEKPPPPPSQECRWEFPRDKLRLQTVLGQGNFGQVWKAEADDLTGHQGTTRLVAVKTVKEGASAREKEDLIRELEIMQQLGNHSNVVTLLGCCTEDEPHYLILEYVMYGKLLAYLRDHRTRQDFYNFSEDSAALTSRDLTVFGYCVARGMEYLASKKIIHRDLAARNVLVDHNKLCKIADFGMSRFANDDGEVIEARHGRNALPIRWMAPESLIYSLFTTKTDVWSFGILMWEIVTLGSTPYPDMAAREVMRNVQSGYRLERPSHCRSELFRVIARCWHADPDRRPEFQTLRRDMAQLLEDSMNGHYVDLESFASECTD